MQNSITRRAVLAASAATTLCAIPAAAGVPPESGLPALIEAYKAAYAAWDEILDPYEEAESRWSEQADKHPIALPVPGGALEARTRSPWWEVREELGDEVKRHFAGLEGRIPSYASDRVRAELLAELRQQKRTAYRQAVVEIRGLREAQEKTGVLSAIEAYHEAYDAQAAASLAILAYPCTTIAECRLKAEFVDQNEGMTSDLLYGNREFVEALLQSFLPEPASARA